MSRPITGPGAHFRAQAPIQTAPSTPASTGAPAAGPASQGRGRSAAQLEDGSWADAQVTLSQQPQAESSAAQGPGRGQGHGRKSADGEFKNHGQMVSAAARAGITGRDLAAIAKGETKVDRAALTAIGNGDVSLSQYQAAQKQVADGGLTSAQLSNALQLVSDRGMTWEAALAEAKKPPAPAAEAPATVADAPVAEAPAAEAPAPEQPTEV